MNKKIIIIGAAIVILIIIIVVIALHKSGDKENKKLEKLPEPKTRLEELNQEFNEIKEEITASVNFLKQNHDIIKSGNVKWMRESKKGDIIKDFPECPMFEPIVEDDNLRKTLSRAKDMYFHLKDVKIPSLSSKSKQIEKSIKLTEYIVENS